MAPSPVLAKALTPGATIAFISPSARLNDTFPAAVARAVALFEAKGYKVQVLYTPDNGGGIQSSIATRLAEVRSAFLDPTVSAIVCTMGGGSTAELLPGLIADTELHAVIRRDPKIVVGSSDVTGFHWFLHACTGLRTFYGPSAIPELGVPSGSAGKDSNNDEGDDGHDDDASSPLAFCVRSLLAAVASPDPIGDLPRSPVYTPKLPAFFRDPASVEVQAVAPAPAWEWLRPGKARGRIFGGYLSPVVGLNGVRAVAPDWRGRIVFLETAIGEARFPDLVREGFANLVAQGVFDEAAGLVVGRPYGFDTEEARGKYATFIRELLCKGRLGAAENQFPILFNVDIGHTSPMVTLPFDVLAELDSESGRFALLEGGVV
ncbi:peptidase u61 ld-carboxypeptidase a [Xylariales sp. PMI_506]|nr:peptidase u61 ld-carboxypeptidase a [Xylariales sp. PMI_506]